MATFAIAGLSFNPVVFTPYVIKRTERKVRVLESGIMTPDPLIPGLLKEGDSTYKLPFYNSLDGTDAENIPTQTDPINFAGGTAAPVPSAITSGIQQGVRLCRNKYWSASQLSRLVAGNENDPMRAIQDGVGFYSAERAQEVVLSILAGILADNDAAPAGSDTHVQFDLTTDASVPAYQEGVTTMSAELLIDVLATMGESEDVLSGMLVHPVVLARMRKNNLIDFIPDAEGRINIPTYLGRRVVVSSKCPSPSAGVYDSYLFGPGFLRYGTGQMVDSPSVELVNLPLAANGAGQKVLVYRWMYSVHPDGHFYAASPTGAEAGPTNAVLAAAASWSRRFPERRQVRFARIRTREA